jgi:hypothetical protein
MEIYIAFVSGALSVVLLAVVYAADRYEPEPIDAIQNAYLAGLLAQLVVILGTTMIAGAMSWSGPWVLVTGVGVALVVPFQLSGRDEVDERFDGIVYTVAAMAGASCVIHLNNLQTISMAAPLDAALGSGAEPDLRDLMILIRSPAVSTELGSWLVLIATAVLVGAVLGSLQLRGMGPASIAPICAAVAVAAIGLDLAMAGHWIIRSVLALAALGSAVALNRRSVFRHRPQAREAETVILGFRTILVVLGAALLTAVILTSVTGPPEPTGDAAVGTAGVTVDLEACPPSGLCVRLGSCAT